MFYGFSVLYCMTTSLARAAPGSGPAACPRPRPARSAPRRDSQRSGACRSTTPSTASTRRGRERPGRVERGYVGPRRPNGDRHRSVIGARGDLRRDAGRRRGERRPRRASRDRLEELAGRIEEDGGQARRWRVTSPTRSRWRDDAAAVERFGRIDILVCNAGTGADAGPMAERLPHALFERTVAVNLLGVWYCCRDAGAVMLDQGAGSIINVSSIAGLAGVAHFPPAYQATKAAVINLTRNSRCRGPPAACASTHWRRAGSRARWPALHRRPDLRRPHPAPRADGARRAWPSWPGRCSSWHRTPPAG